MKKNRILHLFQWRLKDIENEILPLIYNKKTYETIFLTTKKLEKLAKIKFKINKIINKDNNIISEVDETFSVLNSIETYTTLDNYKYCQIYLSRLVLKHIIY